MMVRQQFAIQRVQSLRIHLQQIERGLGRGIIDAAIGLDLGIVAHAAQQPVGNSRRAARTLRDAQRARRVDLHIQDPR